LNRRIIKNLWKYSQITSLRTNLELKLSVLPLLLFLPHSFLTI
jgi:hypothetical protein